ncbi:MAG: hypothetical protein ABIY90_02945 [Puia sp.]
MFKLWESIKQYYMTLGETYHVNPIIFVGIHAMATPIFILSVAWLVSNYRKKKGTIFPIIVTTLVFNAANIYLVIFGRNIPWYIFAIFAVTTVISGYLSYIKIKNKMKVKI